jgi:uncharacterized protein YciI
MAPQTKPGIRFVVFHRPGPRWKHGVDFREQLNIGDHALYYRRLFEEGRLEMGGPFAAADSGGMMIPIDGVSEDEMRSFAAADPAVRSGLLEFEIRPWYVAMRQSGTP